MITDPLLFDLATDHRMPYYKIKLRSRSQSYYGRFEVLLPHKVPLRAGFDAFTEDAWPLFCAGEKTGWEAIDVRAEDIELIELVGYSPIKKIKPKAFSTSSPGITIEMYAAQDTLSRWDLRGMRILKKAPPLIDPKLQY
jgi:hypothetical protein